MLAKECGAILHEGIEQDVEKAEKSIKAEISIKDVEKAESSTKPGGTEKDDEGVVQSTVELLIKSGATSPKLLRKGDGSSCIFRIPHSLTKIHHKGYEPEIVSIGPYHHEKKHLQMIEEHKYRFLQLFLAEAEHVGVTLTDLVKIISDKEDDIRNSYSEKLVWVDSQKLVNMMILDGCFILMLFFFITKKVDSKEKSPHDPILKTPWILPTIRSDLLLLENQVPFILLKTLFGALNKSSLGSGNLYLYDLAFSFFEMPMVVKPEGFGTKHNELEAKHLLDLIRQTFIPSPYPKNATGNSSTGLILSAKRLRLQGIEFIKASKESQAFAVENPQEKKILDIQLKGAEVQLPPIIFDEFISSFLLNCVAFEQLFMECSNDITSYIVFMGCLMNDEADVAYLSEKGIIENYLGNGSDVSQFFKTISNGIAFDMSKSYLEEVFKGINMYTSQKRNMEYARFKHLHFDSPWTCMSSSAVLAILLLTTFQAIMAGVAYFHPPSSDNLYPPPSDKHP